MASYMLRYCLRKYGVKAELKRGHYDVYYHWWLEIDSHIVDITATQFGIKQDVYITANNAKYHATRRKLKPGSFGAWPWRLHPPRYTQFFRGISLK